MCQKECGREINERLELRTGFNQQPAHRLIPTDMCMFGGRGNKRGYTVFFHADISIAFVGWVEVNSLTPVWYNTVTVDIRA